MPCSCSSNPPSPKAPTWAAASSMARGMPSRRRQISLARGSSSSPSSKLS
ncbi:MYXO-CTERM sorting domain-containing protein [Pseudomonas chlororaphis]